MPLHAWIIQWADLQSEGPESLRHLSHHHFLQDGRFLINRWWSKKSWCKACLNEYDVKGWSKDTLLINLWLCALRMEQKLNDSPPVIGNFSSNKFTCQNIKPFQQVERPLKGQQKGRRGWKKKKNNENAKKDPDWSILKFWLCVDT